MTSQSKGSQDPISGFNDLGNDIWMYEPTDSTAPPHTNHAGPTLVMLCAWMGGATAKRLMKYTAKYQEMFPNSALLVIRTTIPNMTFRPVKAVRARLAPAKDAINRIIRTSSSSSPDSQPSILLHMFSNGGVHMAVQLAHTLRESDLAFPLGGMILDCCPGKPTFDRNYRAAAYSLPPGQITQLVGRVMLYPFVGTFLALDRSGLREPVFDFRESLNDPTLFPKDARRLYLFSSKDGVVFWQDIQEHVDESRSQGYPVDSIRFERGTHCALVREEEQYTKAITNFWFKRKDTVSSTSANADRTHVERVPLSSKL